MDQERRIIFVFGKKSEMDNRRGGLFLCGQKSERLGEEDCICKPISPIIYFVGEEDYFCIWPKN